MIHPKMPNMATKSIPASAMVAQIKMMIPAP
jgi:hypothetical protein